MKQIEHICINDFAKICRLCLKQALDNNIFNIPELIITYNTITNMKIQEDDNLPNNICESCVDMLKSINDFISICEASYNALTTILIQEKDKMRNFKEEYDADSSDIFIKSESENLPNPMGDVIEENNKHKQTDNSNLLKLDNNDWNDADVEIYGSDKYKGIHNSLLKCKHCNLHFSRPNHFESHMRIHSGIKPFSCEICSHKFSRKSALTAHKLVHSTTQRQQCNICDWVGKTKTALRRHILRHSNQVTILKHVEKKRKWKCIYCEKAFQKKDDLQRHLRTHTGLRPFECILCDKKFSQNSTLIRHINSRHFDKQPGQKFLECYICEKKFIRKDHLEQHVMNLHIKKQGFLVDGNIGKSSCSECGKNFSLLAYLGHHLSRVHNRSSDIQPQVKVRKTMRKINEFSSIAPKLCSICGKLFEKGKNYHAHMSRSHSLREKKSKPPNVKPKEKYQCWHCGKVVNTHCNLAVHLRVHTGEKPYQCKFCPRRFSVWTCRQEHENIHTGIKPFQCDPCDKAFKQRSALLKHLRSAVHRIQAKI